MRKYGVYLKGQKIAEVEAVSSAWAMETFIDEQERQGISRSTIRGPIPRGVEEFEYEPFEGIECRQLEQRV